MLLRPLSLALLLLSNPAAAQIREVGNIVYDGVPETPPELAAAIAPYYEARSAVFESWMADGSMLIATRFGDTNQIHRLTAPGAARTQLTFFREPVNTATAQPGSDRFLYMRDVGGAEYYQAWLRGLNGAETRITAPRTRNSDFHFTPDGQWVVWSQVTPGDPNYDILMAPVADPEARRVIHEGQGAMSPLQISADGKTVLATRYTSAAAVELFVLDVASGKLTPVGGKAGYQGGARTADGKGIVTLSDAGSDVTRPVVIDIATGKVRDLDPKAMWPAEAFDLTPDGKLIAYSVNEQGYNWIVIRDLASGKDVPTGKLPLGVLTGLGFSPDGKQPHRLPASVDDAPSRSLLT